MTEEYLNIKTLVKRLKRDEKISNEQYYYRGQIHNWPIKSTISRSNYDNEEIQSTYKFLKWLKANKAIQKKESNEYMAIAQHYGYKTDLIDFTKNIDVAAFFATDGINDNDKLKDGYGVIWRISEKEIKEIANLIKIFLNYLNETVDQQCLKYLTSHEYNPFIEVSIPELSRINNQQGVFMWDIHDIITEFYLKNKKPNFRFRQNGNVYSNSNLNQSLIYPKPNSLELEIMRYEYPKNVTEFKKSDLYKQLSKNSIVLKENKNVISNYIDKIIAYDWSSELGNIGTHFPMKIETNTNVEFIDNYDEHTILKVIEKNINDISEGIITYIDFKEEPLNKVINEEVISVLKYSNYSSKEIFYIINAILEQYKKAKNLNLVRDFNAFISRYYDESFLKKLYEEELLYISMADINGVQSYAYIPYNLIKIKMKLMKSKIQQMIINDENVLKQIKNYDEWNLFLIFNQNPQKIFEFEEIKDIFLKYILPYQFICRRKNTAIYVPTYLKILGPE